MTVQNSDKQVVGGGQVDVDLKVPRKWRDSGVFGAMVTAKVCQHITRALIAADPKEVLMLYHLSCRQPVLEATTYALQAAIESR